MLKSSEILEEMKRLVRRLPAGNAHDPHLRPVLSEQLLDFTPLFTLLSDKRKFGALIVVQKTSWIQQRHFNLVAECLPEIDVLANGVVSLVYLYFEFLEDPDGSVRVFGALIMG